MFVPCGRDIDSIPQLCNAFFLGGATYHLKKTKRVSEAQKEAVCIVNMVRGIKTFSLGSDGPNIFATWAFNNLERDGISVVPVPVATKREKL